MKDWAELPGREKYGLENVHFCMLVRQMHFETQSDLLLESLPQSPPNCGCFPPCLLLLTFSPFFFPAAGRA